MLDLRSMLLAFQFIRLKLSEICTSKKFANLSLIHIDRFAHILYIRQMSIFSLMCANSYGIL